MNKRFTVTKLNAVEKISLLLLLIVVILSPNHSVRASEHSSIEIQMQESIRTQTVTMNLRNVSMAKVLDEIMKQTEIGFSMDEQAKKVTNLTISVKEMSVEATLNKLLADINFGYKIVGNTIAIFSKESTTVQVTDERIEVKGRVVDEKGEPIVGATVLVEGTQIGAITDTDGAFVFKADRGAKVIVSFVGYIEQTIAVSESMQIILTADALAVDDVVVTGYQNIEKGRATGSYDVVSKKSTDQVISSNIIDKLAGNVAGLRVDSDGDMLIRGQASLYAETKPLVVVDGFPMEYDAANINPNDIANITVLKDAAAASIWGVRAANGVIVITTKNAKTNQKLTVSYNGNLKIGSIRDLESLEYMSSEDQIAFERSAYETGYYNMYFGYGLENAFWGYTPITETYFNSSLTDTEKEAKYAEFASFNNTQQVKDNFYRTPIFQQHNVTISAGSETTTTYLSLNYEQNLAELIGNETDKVSFQLNNTFKLTNWARAQIGVRGNYGDGSSYSEDPYTKYAGYVPFVDNNGNTLSQYTSQWAEAKKNLAESYGFQDWSYNMLDDRELVDNHNKNYNFTINAKFDFDLPFNIKFSTSGMYIVDNSETNILYDKNSYYVRDQFNTLTDYDAATGVMTNHLPAGAQKNSSMVRGNSYTWRNVLSYNKEFENISINAQAGTEMFAMRTFTNSDVYFGFDPQGMTWSQTLNYDDLVNVGVPSWVYPYGNYRLSSFRESQSDIEDRYFSMFGTADVTYLDKYTIFGSLRYDKTNLFGQSTEYRDQPTWSVGGRWSVSREEFFKSSIIDDLGVKASYGLSGNVDKSTSPYLIGTAKRDYFTDKDIIEIVNPENPLLSWEKVYTVNLGFDIAMFDHRLNISVDAYNRVTEDALSNTIIETSSGFSEIKMNSASILNRGFDLTIGGDVIRKKSFIWNSSLNLSYNYNKVTAINSDSQSFYTFYNERPLEGLPIDYIYAYNYAGLNDNGEALFYNAAGEEIHASAYNTAAQEDLLYMGTYSPKVFGGWSNHFNYKGFALDVLLTYQFGSKFREPNNYYEYFMPFDGSRLPEYLNTVYSENNTNTMVPAWDFTNRRTSYSHKVYNMSNINIVSGDYIRLKSLGLSYDFKRIIKTDLVSALTLKFTAENLGLWVANEGGYDPDRSPRSVGYSSLYYYGTMPKFFSLSLNVTF